MTTSIEQAGEASVASHSDATLSASHARAKRRKEEDSRRDAKLSTLILKEPAAGNRGQDCPRIGVAYRDVRDHFHNEV